MNADQSLGAFIGIKLTQIVAGFAGGVVSLAFLQGLSRKQAVLAVVVGCLSSAYLTDPVVYFFNIGPSLINGTAFVIGLCAMNIIPLIKKAVAQRVEGRIASGDDPKKDTP